MKVLLFAASICLSHYALGQSVGSDKISRTVPSSGVSSNNTTTQSARPTTKECFCGGISFGSYTPIDLHSANELPITIQQKVTAYLKDKAGDTFCKKLVFCGGRFVDIADMHKNHPSTLNFRWTPRSYYLCYRYYLPYTINGSPMDSLEYVTEFNLDSIGNVTGEASLPDMSKYPTDVLIPYSKAVRIARRHGITFSADEKKELAVDHLWYSKKDVSFTWRFHNRKRIARCTWREKVVIMKASSGEVIVNKKYVRSSPCFE